MTQNIWPINRWTLFSGEGPQRIFYFKRTSLKDLRVSVLWRRSVNNWRDCCTNLKLGRVDGIKTERGIEKDSFPSEVRRRTAYGQRADICFSIPSQFLLGHHCLSGSREEDGPVRFLKLIYYHFESSWDLHNLSTVLLLKCGCGQAQGAIFDPTDYFTSFNSLFFLDRVHSY